MKSKPSNILRRTDFPVSRAHPHLRDHSHYPHLRLLHLHFLLTGHCLSFQWVSDLTLVLKSSAKPLHVQLPPWQDQPHHPLACPPRTREDQQVLELGRETWGSRLTKTW